MQIIREAFTFAYAVFIIFIFWFQMSHLQGCALIVLRCGSAMEHSTRMALDLYKSTLLLMSFISVFVMIITSSTAGQICKIHS